MSIKKLIAAAAVSICAASQPAIARDGGLFANESITPFTNGYVEDYRNSAPSAGSLTCAVPGVIGDSCAPAVPVQEGCVLSSVHPDAYNNGSLLPANGASETLPLTPNCPNYSGDFTYYSTYNR